MQLDKCDKKLESYKKMSALNFIGRVDTREQSLLLNLSEEKQVITRLLENRDPSMLHMMFGERYARDVYTPLRGASGKNVVMPFYN